jgi:nucleoside-diphosphate-sugar epimerase
VQGQIDDPPATEEYRVEPGDHYQESKLEGERLAVEYSAKGFPLVVVRPVGIYGPGDLRFLKLFRAIHRRRFVMIGSGETLYHLTYIDDLVEGFLLAGRSPHALGEVITIAGRRYTTLNELVALIARVLGKPRPRLRIPFAPVYAASVLCERACTLIGVSPPLYPRRVEFFSKDRAFDITKARRLLGYEPAVELEEGLRRTATWYRQAGLQ